MATEPGQTRTAGHPERRVGPIVAAAVAGAVGALVVFGLGIGVGVWASRSAPAVTAAATPSAQPAQPAPSEPADPAPGGDAAAPSADGSFDDCLVGTWTTTEQSEEFDLEEDGGVVTVSGVQRRLVFTADGRETATYDGSEATVETADGTGTIRFDGVAQYQVRTSAGTMMFELLSAEGTVSVTDAEGQEQTRPLQPGAGDVRYTCDETTMTQSGSGYEATFERAA